LNLMRNVLGVAPRGNADMFAAAIRIIFAQPDTAHNREQLAVTADMLGRQQPEVKHTIRRARRT
jgi:putative transposase